MNQDVTNREGQYGDGLERLGPGAVVDGKYRIDAVLGRGGMGIVVAATHLGLNERVALKFLRIRDTEAPGDFRARFELEARVCAKMRSDHLVRVHDVGVWEGRVPYMVMDHLVGRDLRRVLKDEPRLAAPRAVSYAVQMCHGLAEAHARGIVHRDLKPPNIFLTTGADGGDLVKVLDFGISKSIVPEDDMELTKTGVMLGSPKYMSPEQLNGDTIDARADVWSIGAMLYEMLAGRPPYDFVNVTQTFVAIATGAPPPSLVMLVPDAPPALEGVILRCLEHDREKRIASVAELAGALLEAIESPLAEPIRARLAAVLDPTLAPQAREAVLGTTFSTGSHAAFAFGDGTTASGPRRNSDASPSRAPEAVASLAPGSRVKRWGLVAGAVAALAVAATMGAQLGGGDATAASTTSAKLAPSKHVAIPGATLLAVRAETDAAREPKLPARSARIAQSAPRAKPSASSAPPPSIATVSAPASSEPRAAPARSANPLDDRQ